MNAARHLRLVEREAEFFAESLHNELTMNVPSLEYVLDRYVEMRKNSAEFMQAALAAWLDKTEWRLNAVIEEVEGELRSRMAGVVPLEAVRVPGYRGMRLILYEFLALHLAEPVGVAKLRALTGDQIHTERRLRELRDLGIRLEARRRTDEDTYTLVSDRPDVEIAWNALAKKVVNRVPGWSPARKAKALEELGF